MNALLKLTGAISGNPIYINQDFIESITHWEEGSQIRMISGGKWNVKETSDRIVELIKK